MPSNSAIVTELIANDAQYQKAISRAVESNLKYQRSADNNIIDANSRIDASFSKAANMVKGFAAAVTATGAGALLAAREVSKSAIELDNLARVAGLSVAEFQAASFATEQYGVSAEKLADISKDAQDKLGDFLATGGGELKAFFETIGPQVGITAEALQGLSGAQVLGAVKSAMDQVNISAEEQTFYLEAIANDASLLAPLLADNGAELERLNRQYSRLNTAIDTQDMAALREMNSQFSAMDKAIENAALSITAKLAPPITGIANLITEAFSPRDQAASIEASLSRIDEGIEARRAEIEAIQGMSAADIYISTGTSYGLKTQAGIDAEKNRQIGSANQALQRLIQERAGLQAQLDALNKKPELPAMPAIPTGPFSAMTTGGNVSDEQLQSDIERLIQSYASKEELLLQNTLNEQELLIAAQNDRLISEQQAQALSIQSWDRYYQEAAKLAEHSAGQQVEIERNAAQSMVDSITGSMEITNQMFRGFASGMSAAITDAALTGELSFGKMAESIVADMTRMYVQAQIVQPLMASMGFSFGTPTATAGVNHTGGIAGIADAGTRAVSLSAFADAPRFHTGGIIGSEVPIIAQRGEGVFTREQMKNLSPVTKAPKVSIQLINNGTQQEVERTEQTQNGDMTQIRMWIRDVVTGDINSGQGIDRALRTQYPSLARRGYG